MRSGRPAGDAGAGLVGWFWMRRGVRPTQVVPRGEGNQEAINQYGNGSLEEQQTRRMQRHRQGDHGASLAGRLPTAGEVSDQGRDQGTDHPAQRRATKVAGPRHDLRVHTTSAAISPTTPVSNANQPSVP